MDKLRVGVIVYEDSKPTEGGGHSYYYSFLKAINKHTFSKEIEIINIIFHTKESKVLQSDFEKPSILIRGGFSYQNRFRLKAKETETSYVQPSFFFSRKNPLINLYIEYIKHKREKGIEQILRENKIDLVYYLKQELRILDYPFIATNWDVAHRSMHPFPQTSSKVNFELRENYYQYSISKAFIIFCESEAGRKELLSFYPIQNERIKVLPMFAGDILNQTVNDEDQTSILRRFKLTKRTFFLYPAQFWACKNHYNLIYAFKKLVEEDKKLELKLVLSGSDKGNLQYIQELISDLNLTERVIITGFVSNKELYTFYKNALALTMPTYLGPTNIPLLEAAHLKCTVLCSDLAGHREMLEDNAIYFAPADVNSICNSMKAVLDNTFRDALAEAAYNHIQTSKFNIDNAIRILNETLLEIIPKRKIWGLDF